MSDKNDITDLIPNGAGDGWEQPRVNPRLALKFTRKDEEWELQERFLESFRKYLTIKRGCLDAMIPTSRFYAWKRNDERFRRKFQEANEEVVDQLEDEAVRRATIGDLVPIFYEGAIVGWKNEKSDALLMFLLKGKKPEVYRERQNNLNIGESTVLIIPSNGREVVSRQSEVVSEQQNSQESSKVELPER